MSDLRKNLIRVAYENPGEIRKALLPLLHHKLAGLADLPKWSEIYPQLHYSWIQSMNRLLARPGFKKEFAALNTGRGKILWSDVEDLAKKHSTTWKTLSLMAIYLYGHALEKWGDYIRLTNREPKFLSKILMRPR